MTDYEKTLQRLKNLEKDVQKYCEDTEVYILDRALVSEIYYRYECYVLDEENNNLPTLELKDLINMADILLNDDYFNESMNSIIIDELFNYHK